MKEIGSGKRAVFMDRDGTINIDRKGYIKNPQTFELYPFSTEAIRRLNRMDFLTVVVTNQSGIARDYYSIEDLESIHRKMEKELARGGAKLDEIYYSPFHRAGIIEPFAIDHEDRKPGLGMFRKAREKYDLDIDRSYMIGDKDTDIAFGRRAGLRTILVLTGQGRIELLENRNKWQYKPHYICDNLLTAVELIETLG